MTLDSSGNLGIGTASPGEKLEVAGNVESEGLKLNVNTSMYTQDASLSYYSSTNAVYLNGAGNNGWLRLNASGTQNDGVAINLFGSAAGPVGFKFAEFNDLKLVGALYANALWPKFTLNTLALVPVAQAKAIG